MPHAVRVVDRIQDQADFGGSVGDGKVLQWVTANSRFEPSTAAAAGLVELHAEVLASDQTEVILGNGGTLPQIYREMQLVWAVRSTMAGTGADLFHCRFNGDTGTNYDTDFWFASSATTAQYNASESTYRLGNAPQAGAAAGYSSSGIVSLPYYANASWFKHAICSWLYGVANASASFAQGRYTCIWRNINPITSARLYCNGGSIKSVSFIGLYGRR